MSIPKISLSLVCWDCGPVFDQSQFRKVVNVPHWHKPEGGLWTSPTESSWGWFDWCRENSFSDLRESFLLDFHGSVCVVDSEEALNEIPWIQSDYAYLHGGPDFELLAQTYDAFWLTEKGQAETHYAFEKRNLHGWDCEIVLVFNPLSLTPKKCSNA